MRDIMNCQLCGGSPQINTDWGDDGTRIECSVCHCMGQIGCDIDSHEEPDEDYLYRSCHEAIDAWNSMHGKLARLELLEACASKREGGRL